MNNQTSPSISDKCGNLAPANVPTWESWQQARVEWEAQARQLYEINDVFRTSWAPQSRAAWCQQGQALMASTVQSRQAWAGWCGSVEQGKQPLASGASANWCRLSQEGPLTWARILSALAGALSSADHLLPGEARSVVTQVQGDYAWLVEATATARAAWQTGQHSSSVR